MEIDDYTSAINYLMGRLNYERTPARRDSQRLDRMHQLLARLGDPHLAQVVVHVAGTKGKGSVAAMISEALTAAGHRTALYTSPHFTRLEERMRVDGQCCPAEELVELTRQVQQVADAMQREGQPLTFFELTTAISMLHFARQRAELAVLETGLGGRLDSTNVCRPLVSVITSISYDHTRQLGSTLERIAAEKCGIIKPGRPVVSGVGQPQPRQVVRDAAQQRGCPLSELGRDFHCEEARLDVGSLSTHMRYRDRRQPPLEAVLSLLGRHQARNAALALATLAELAVMGIACPPQTALQSLRQTRLPARVEVLGRRPDVLLDVAHNVASVQALADVLDEGFPASHGGRRRLVFATSGDKDPAGMLQILLPRFQHVLLTRYVTNPRSVRPDKLQEVARQLQRDGGGPQLSIHGDPQQAWRQARQASTADDLVCVAGSFFLAAELRDPMRQGEREQERRRSGEEEWERVTW